MSEKDRVKELAEQGLRALRRAVAKVRKEEAAVKRAEARKSKKKAA